MDKEFKYKIVKKIGVLSSKKTKNMTVTKEVNLVSYDNKEPMYDIRAWRNLDTGEKMMMKGITLKENEFEALKQVLSEGESA